jgi:two-component system, OmpR family, sensor histidine kinase KdpD
VGEQSVHATWRGVGAARRLGGVGLAVLGLPALTAALIGVRDELAQASVLLLYVLAIVVVAAVGGAVSGVLAAVLSFGLVSWFFLAPIHTLEVHGRDALIDLAVFGVTATVVSATVELAARDRAQTQRQLAEQAARTRVLAAEDRARTALLAAVGHDLRTPLANVKAAVGSLRQDEITWSPDQVAELLATIEDSTDRLTGLVTNLLDMSRLEADALTVQLSAVPLDEVVARVLLNGRQRYVDVQVDEDLPPALADAALLERVVENLVENAVRYSPPDRPVEIRAELDGPASSPATHDQSRVVLLHVVDHGPGIPSERRDEVFRAFQRLDDRGSGSHVGLGLAIVQGFVDAMGGEITPSTTPGGGVTMSVALPVAA